MVYWWFELVGDLQKLDKVQFVRDVAEKLLLRVSERMCSSTLLLTQVPCDVPSGEVFRPVLVFWSPFTANSP
jgi:hypothetical protein